MQNLLHLTSFIFYTLVVFISAAPLANAGGETMSKNSALATLQLKADGILREINQQIGEASCSTDEQCRTLPVGHRACGGPAAYLAYSIDKIDEDKLIELSKEHTATHREINRLKELMSTCEMLMPPPIACINNRCVIQLHQSK